MQLIEMYEGIPNSPEMFIVADISDSSTEIHVQQALATLKTPNLLVIGGNLSNSETVKVVGIEGNTLTVERGFEGLAQSWAVGTPIARNFTAYDYNALVGNVRALEGGGGIATDMPSMEAANLFLKLIRRNLPWMPLEHEPEPEEPLPTPIPGTMMIETGETVDAKVQLESGETKELYVVSEKDVGALQF